MADEKFMNWEKLTDYPIYAASMMKPCELYEQSILGLVSGSAITPSSVFADTTKDNESLTIRVSSPGHVQRNMDARVNERMSKEEFTQIMYECVRSNPKKFVWEHPAFHAIFDGTIIKLCAKMNTLDIGDVYLRAGKSYTLGRGVGLIYNEEVPSGAFSGLVIKAVYASGVAVDIVIPRLVYNINAGSLSSARLVYTDKESNLKIVIPGKLLSEASDGTFSARIASNSEFINKIDSRSKILYIPEDSYADMVSKRLRVLMTRFDFKLSGAMSAPTVKEVHSEVPTGHALNRLAMIRR